MAPFYQYMLIGMLGLAAAAGSVRAADVSAANGDPFSALAVASHATLAEQAGQKDVLTENVLAISNSSSQEGSVGNAYLNNSATGANTIANGAFAGMSGIGTVFQNSGNNVVMQNSTIVNVTMH